MTRSHLWLLGIGTLALLLATASGHLYSIDGLQYYRVATEMVFDRSVTFDPPLDWGGPITTPITTIGFSLTQTPAVLAAWPFWDLQPSATSGVPYDSRLLYGDPLYTAVSWVNPAITSVTAVVAALQAAALGLSARRSLLVALAVVFGTPLFFYAFDLLFSEGEDLRSLPLRQRKERLKSLLAPSKLARAFRYVDHLQNPGLEVLQSACKMGLEGIVSKRRDAPYRSGKCDWVKVKCVAWREANKNRGDLFNKEKRR